MDGVHSVFYLSRVDMPQILEKCLSNTLWFTVTPNNVFKGRSCVPLCKAESALLGAMRHQVPAVVESASAWLRVRPPIGLVPGLVSSKHQSQKTPIPDAPMGRAVLQPTRHSIRIRGTCGHGLSATTDALRDLEPEGENGSLACPHRRSRPRWPQAVKRKGPKSHRTLQKSRSRAACPQEEGGKKDESFYPKL